MPLQTCLLSINESQDRKHSLHVPKRKQRKQLRRKPSESVRRPPQCVWKYLLIRHMGTCLTIMHPLSYRLNSIQDLLAALNNDSLIKYIIVKDVRSNIICLPSLPCLMRHFWLPPLLELYSHSRQEIIFSVSRTAYSYSNNSISSVELLWDNKGF